MPGPPRDIPYTVQLTVGAYSWDFYQGDALPLPAPVDGLQLARKLVASDLWPPPEDLAELKFQLVAATAADLAIDVGDPVIFRYQHSHTAFPDDDEFYGRVGEVTMAPHDLGVIFTVSCLDYRADLRELTAGKVDYPAETILARVERIFAEIGHTVTITSVDRLVDTPSVAARTASPTSAYDLITHYLLQWPAVLEFIAGFPRDPALMVLDFDIDAEGLFAGWRISPVTTSPTYDPPMHLETVGGLVTAVPNTNLAGTALVGVDGATVEWSSSYAMTKADTINAVTVSGQVGGAEYSITVTTGQVPRVSASIDGVELTTTGPYAQLGAMYLPSGAGTRWVADAFTWRLELTVTADREELGELRSLILVGNLDPDRNPNGDSWYVGLLESYTLTITDSRPVYDFQLRRPDFGSSEATGLIPWNDPQLTGVTWDDLNPADSWADYRLVRED